MPWVGLNICKQTVYIASPKNIIMISGIDSVISEQVKEFSLFRKVYCIVSDPDSGVFWMRNPDPGSYKKYKMVNHHLIILLFNTFPFQLVI